MSENICSRCSTVGVKGPLARSVVGVETPGCEGDKGLTAGRVMPEAVMRSGMNVSLGWQPTDDTRESFSSDLWSCRWNRAHSDLSARRVDFALLLFGVGSARSLGAGMC